MKKKVLAFVLCGALAAAFIAGCGGGSGSAAQSTPVAASVKNSSSSASGASAASSVKAGTTVESGTEVSLDKVDIMIAFGDYTTMESLAKEIQGGRAAGKVVQIDGLVSNFSKGMSYNITEKDENAGKSVGTMFKILGAEEEEYPADGTHVQITGAVVQDPENGALFYIQTRPEYVKILE